MENWDKEEIIKELENHFKVETQEGKEEIKDTLSFSNPSFSKFDNAGKVEIEGIEYCIIQNEEEAEKITKEIVKNDLEEDPSMFNQDWLSDFIYISECDKRIMAGEEENYIRECQEWTEEEVEKRVKEYEKSLEDPIEYFVNEQGMYTLEQLLEAPFICIDYEEATESAISTDGWAHFLSRYDGEYETTNNGLIIFREC